MKDFKQLTCMAMYAMAFALVAASCSEQEVVTEQMKQNEGLNICKMEFKASLTDYDSPSTRSETNWADSSRVYLQFLNGTERVTGEALYDAELGQWSVSYYGKLPEGTSLTCEALYFENIDSTTTAGLVVTNEYTAIYEDLKGSYLYENEALTVVANLAPKTGRVRFTGEAGTKMKLTGISSYATYEPRSSHFTTTNKLIEVSTDANQTTPYVYGFFTNDTVRYLGLMANDYAFTKACKEGMMDKGVSGYLSIPTLERCNGWEKGLRVRVKGVEFLMIPCPDYDTKSSFAIGETEVTQELYQAVMGSNPSSNKASLQHPVDYISSTYASSLIKSLCELTSLTFVIPTYEQWRYAAQGGSGSQGYVYSGSDNIEEVAWYTKNSNGKTHKVKTKQANELGIYDMNGNVAEICYYSSSSSSIYYYGGYYASNSDYCMISKSYSTEISYSSNQPKCGMRLAINY